MSRRADKRVNKTPVILGIIGFFLLVAGISTIVILTFSAVSEQLADNKTAIALIMLAVIAAVSALCTAVDFVRRRFTVEKPVREILAAGAAYRFYFQRLARTENAVVHYPQLRFGAC